MWGPSWMRSGLPSRAERLMIRRVMGVVITGLVMTALAWGQNDPIAPPSHEPLVLTFAGDLMQHDRNAAMPDYDRIYDAVRPYLTTDDLSFANLEFPVDPSRQPTGYPIFNGSVEYVEAAIHGGFDVLSVANNHTYDLGEGGLNASRREFNLIAESHRVFFNGIRPESDAPIDVTPIEANGWAVGFVAITAFSNMRGSAPHIHLVNYLNPDTATSFLQQVSEWDSEFDLLVVSVHAGTEYTSQPDEHKAQFFRDLIAHGADIVWGHHPHVLQPYETIWWGGATKLILHSTGNFISAQRRLQQPFLPVGRWAPTGDLALFRVAVELREGRAHVPVVETPVFTVHEDTEHGLVPRTFGALFTEQVPLVWRSFYLARYAATRKLLDRPIRGFTFRGMSSLPEFPASAQN